MLKITALISFACVLVCFIVLIWRKAKEVLCLSDFAQVEKYKSFSNEALQEERQKIEDRSSKLLRAMRQHIAFPANMWEGHMNERSRGEISSLIMENASDRFSVKWLQRRRWLEKNIPFYKKRYSL